MCLHLPLADLHECQLSLRAVMSSAAVLMFTDVPGPGRKNAQAHRRSC